MRHAAAILASAALALASTHASAINKCVDPHGKVTYQEGSCPGQSKQEAVKVPVTPSKAAPHAAPPPKAYKAETSGGMLAPGEDREDAQLDDAVAALALHEGCAAAAPEFVAKHQAEYHAWRSRHAGPLEKLRKSRRYMHTLQSVRQRVQAQLASKDSRTAYARSCESQLLPTLAH